MSNENNYKRELIDLLKKMSLKIDNIENEIELIKKDTKKIDVIRKNVQSLLNYKKEMKSYQAVNSKEFEKEVTRWLYNYFENNNFSSQYYIPSDKEIPRNVLNINTENKKIKSITDLDGVIVQTNINPSNKRDSNNIKYTLHIIEAKHKLDKGRIKKKIRQVIKFYKMINNKNSNSVLTKFKDCKICLYFASPITEKFIYDFVLDKNYLKLETWEKDKNKMDLNEINFINNIYLISKNEGKFEILNKES